MTAALGFDTSNYTTSAAVYAPWGCYQSGKLLDVPEGTLGLRQNEALFQHIRNLPERISVLKDTGMLHDISVVGASTRPRAVEGSYMPCFFAGEGQARTIADILDVPFFSCSHQQGHIAAACWSAGQESLLDAPMLVWHLSGGTTELLLCRPDGSNVHADILGGTLDISAGQLIDRAGRSLGVNFPAGKGLDILAGGRENGPCFPVKVRDMKFSLSGMENKVNGMVENGVDRETTASFVLDTVCAAVLRATEQALELYPGLPVLFSGGVSSNSRLRRMIDWGVFAQPEFSTDNAMGVAILAARRMERGC